MKPTTPQTSRTKLYFVYRKWGTGQAIVMAVTLLVLFFGMYALAVTFKAGGLPT